MNTLEDTRQRWSPSLDPIWRPLLNSEYPPPGPTKLGPTPQSSLGDTSRSILVFAPPLRCHARPEGEQCRLIRGHEGRCDYEMKMHH